jgi:hypothetical protein
VKEQRRERIRREVGERRERGEKRGCGLILRERERAWREDKDDSMERYRAAQISKFVCGRKHGENFFHHVPTHLFGVDRFRQPIPKITIFMSILFLVSAVLSNRHQK